MKKSSQKREILKASPAREIHASSNTAIKKSALLAILFFMVLALTPCANVHATEGINSEGDYLPLGAGGNVVITLTSTGNVGIGTQTPKTSLDVNGPIRVGTAQSGTNCSVEGAIAYDASNKTLIYCNGSSWKHQRTGGIHGVPLTTMALFHSECSTASMVSSGWGYLTCASACSRFCRDGCRYGGMSCVGRPTSGLDYTGGVLSEWDSASGTAGCFCFY